MPVLFSTAVSCVAPPTLVNFCTNSFTAPDSRDTMRDWFSLFLVKKQNNIGYHLLLDTYGEHTVNT